LTDRGELITGGFTGAQEEHITEALHKHSRLRLSFTGIGEFEPSGRLRRIVQIDEISEEPESEQAFDSDSPPIWEEIVRIGESVSAAEWNKVPTDLAANLDRYLYGKSEDDKA